jgi:MATE family multidrug resistance protein
MGWMLMTIVDTIMVGRMRNSALSIGATSLGGGIFYTLSIFAGGMLLGLDTLVSQAHGRNDTPDANHSLLQALYMVVVLSPLTMFLIALGPAFLTRFGIAPDLVAETARYLNALNWSVLPLLCYFALRRYLQAFNHVGVVMFGLLSSNLINLAGNYILIYGHLGFPAMGVAGSGWSTVWARVYLLVVLIAALVYYARRDSLHLTKSICAPDFARIMHLLRLGAPVAFQILAEIGVFSVAAIFAGKLGPLPLSAHQVAMNCAAFAYMVPLGVSAAAAVRVGQAIGRGRPQQARRAGHAAMLLGCGFMSLAAIVFLAAPYYCARIFTPNPAIIAASRPLLYICAAWAFFDGLQIVATGALRGLGDTRTPMLTNIVIYWFFGLPLGVLFCFRFHLGVLGLWIGLCLALIIIGSALFAIWERNPQFALRKIPSSP